jgi:hypothetical protein
MISLPSPQAWSAFGAICSATCAFLVWKIQRRNLLESVRPELVLSDWHRSTQFPGQPSEFELIEFRKIWNYGRGCAFRILINEADSPLLLLPNPPATVMTFSTQVLAPTAPNNCAEIQGRIHVYWNNVAGPKHLRIKLDIGYSDTRDNRYRTFYSLSIAQDPATYPAPWNIAPGMTAHRATTVTHARLLRTYIRLSRLPWAGKVFRKLASS